MFSIGDKVRCINDTIDGDKIFEILRDFKIWVVKDREYTIRDILHNDDIVAGILLEEVHNTPKFFSLINRYQEPAFATWRFVKTASAEISEFESAENIKELQELLIPRK